MALLKNNWKNLTHLEPRLDKAEAVKAGRFLLAFIFVYLLVSSTFYWLVPITIIEEFIASALLSFLGLFGHSGTISVQETAVIMLYNGMRIEISELCTGLMEIFVLASAVIASFGIAWKKRLLGVVLGTIALVALNFARIFATSLVLLSSAPLALIELAHDILFRAFLFIAIAAAYCIWFYWAVVITEEAKGKKALPAGKQAKPKGK